MAETGVASGLGPATPWLFLVVFRYFCYFPCPGTPDEDKGRREAGDRGERGDEEGERGEKETGKKEGLREGEARSVQLLVLSPLSDPVLAFQGFPHVHEIHTGFPGVRPNGALNPFINIAQTNPGTLFGFLADGEPHLFCETSPALQCLLEPLQLYGMLMVLQPIGHLWDPRGRRALTRRAEPAPRAGRARLAETHPRRRGRALEPKWLDPGNPGMPLGVVGKQ